MSASNEREAWELHEKVRCDDPGQKQAAATPSPLVWLWRSLFGLPDGVFVRLRCRILGHAWWPCDPGCCNRWNCERCALMGPTLDQPDPRPREFSWPI